MVHCLAVSMWLVEGGWSSKLPSMGPVGNLRILAIPGNWPGDIAEQIVRSFPSVKSLVGSTVLKVPSIVFSILKAHLTAWRAKLTSS